MTVREVYEASKGKPWDVPGVWFANGSWYHIEVPLVPIPDSLAASAMLRAMVEWLVRELPNGLLLDSTDLGDVLSVCQALTAHKKGEGK